MYQPNALVLHYDTRHGDDLFLWRLPEGLDEASLQDYAVAAACLIILDNEDDGWIEPRDWREIVRHIAVKEFEAALEYWQDCRREDTYLSWHFQTYPTDVITTDQIAEQARATYAALPEEGEEDEEDEEDADEEADEGEPA